MKNSKDTNQIKEHYMDSSANHFDHSILYDLYSVPLKFQKGSKYQKDRKLIRQFAEYHQKEGFFDWSCYDDLYQTFLLIRDDGYSAYVYGALQVETLGEDEAELKWIWIHPFKRNQGIGSNTLRALNNIYKDLTLSFPLSKAMDYTAIKAKLYNKRELEGANGCENNK